MRKARAYKKQQPQRKSHSHNTAQIFRVVFEDSELIVIEKLQGFQSQRSDRHPKNEGFDEFLARSLKKAIFPVHRLDREVLGLMVFAKTQKMASALTELFRERKMRKIYWARVSGRVASDSGELIHFLRKNERTNHTTVFIRPTEGAKRAELKYYTFKRHERDTELFILLKTGRSHQIRAQLAKIGHPIKGDRRYGKGEGTIQLRSVFLGFDHPSSGETLSFSLLPKESGLEKLL